MDYYEFMSPEEYNQKPITTQPTASPKGPSDPPSSPPLSLNTEVDQMMQSIQASEWGSKLGSFFGQVKKSGTVYIDATKKEMEQLAQTAKKDLDDFAAQVRQETNQTMTSLNRSMQQSNISTGTGGQSSSQAQAGSTSTHARSPSFNAFWKNAPADLQKLGTGLQSFLKDAVHIAPPDEQEEINAQPETKRKNKKLMWVSVYRGNMI